MQQKFQKFIQNTDSKNALCCCIQLNNLLMLSYLICKLVQGVTLLIIILLMLICISGLYISQTNRFAQANPYFICLSSFLLLLVQTETMGLNCLIQLMFAQFYYNQVFSIYRSKMIRKAVTIVIMYSTSIIYVLIRQYSNLSTLEQIVQIITALLMSSYQILEYFNKRTSILSVLDDTLNHINQQSVKEIPIIQPSDIYRIDDLQQQKRKESSMHINEYAAFDIFPNAIIILDKDENDEFEIKYLNRMISQVFDTSDNQQILSNLLSLQDEHNQNQSEVSNVGMISIASYQSALKLSVSSTKFKNLLRIPSYTIDQLIPVPTQNHLKEADDLTQKQQNQFRAMRSINQFKRNSYQFQPYKFGENKGTVYILDSRCLRFIMYMKFTFELNIHEQIELVIQFIALLDNNKYHDLASNDHLIDSTFGTILEQIWTKAQQFDSVQQLQPLPLEYLNESSVFVSKIDIKGKMIFLDLKAYAAMDKGKIIMIIIIRDVSYRDYIKTLQSYSKQKSQTLSFVSHELRTPLNCSISILDMILQNTSFQDKNDIELIKSAKVNMEYCLNIAQDLLDLAQMKSGKFQLNLTSFNLNNIIQDCFHMFRIQANKQGISLNILYECDQIIQSDEQRIRQVIINLVNNALKFTLEGSITIKCIKEENGFIYMEVSDTGIGIKKEDQPKLLKAFGKIQDNETKQLNSKGVGLGLIISNQICQQLSITNQGLGFISDYGKGSTFYFRFKNHSNAQSSSDYQDIIELDNEKTVDYKINVLNSAQISTQSINKSILIVDDNQFNIDALKMLLKKLITNKHQIDSTISGYLAEEMCINQLNSQKHYSIIFMDIEMPFQDGITTSKKIRQIYSDHSQQVLIIGCSAYNSQEIQEIQVMDDYVVKPVSMPILQEKLAKYYYK